MVIFGISALGMNPSPDAVDKFGEFQSVSIPKLFIAGIFPGLLLALSLLIMNYFLCRKYGYKGTAEGWSLTTIGRAFKTGIWSILAPLVILGGIYTGFFTPTESAIVAIFYTLVIGFLVHRELKLENLFHSLQTTTWLTGRVLLILFTATVFGRLLVENEIPAIIAEGMLSVTDNIFLIWAMLIFFLLFVGMFMEDAGHHPDPDAGAAADRLQPGHRPVALRHRHGLLLRDRLPDSAARGEPVHRIGHIQLLHRGDIAACDSVRAGCGGRGVHHRLRTGDLPLATQGARILTATRRNRPMPAQVRKLLFCSDLSENSNVALRYAAWLAKLSGADMHVLHVVEELSTDAKVTIQGFLMDAAARNEALNERVRNIRTEVMKQQEAFWSQQAPDDQKIREQIRSIDVIESYPAEQILRTSVKLGCDLIVMGAHEKGLSHTFLGGVAKSVLRRSRVPTLIVPLP